MFDWLRRRRRRKLLATPVPDHWETILSSNVQHDAWLSPQERARLRDVLRILVAEKNWEGCGGLEMDDEIRVTIAGQASLLLLGIRETYFDLMESILVYPSAFVVPSQESIGSGLVVEGESHNEGEAWYRGPVVLSWPEALAGGRGKSGASNLVLHEFAHQLDMENGGEVDGMPVLGGAITQDEWQRVMRVAYARLVRDCRHGRRTLLDCYGASDVSEFFAVATECFFQRPLAMRREHGPLYDALSRFYRQDPASRREQLA
jgi:Mlc titration factor MtfA (ptsG expression regulator)